jgi:hypothetical protein
MSYANPNILPSGTTFPQFQQGGASGQLERLIAVNSSSSTNPSVAATLSTTGGGTAGGLLAPGVYYVNFTETDGFGETTLSAEAGPITVAAQAAPTGTPTVVVSGTGGTLPAGVYRGKLTYIDANLNASGTNGETTPGTEFSFTQTSGALPVITINDGGLPSWASGRNLYLTAAGGATNTEVLAFSGITGTTYTIAAAPVASTVSPPSTSSTTTNIPKITAFPALQPGNSARNIYLTPPNGVSGSEVLYFRETTAATFTFSTAAPGSNYAVAPPSTNTTSFAALDYQLIRATKDGNLEDVYRQLRQLIYQWNHGSPVAPGQTVTRLKRIHNSFALLAQLCSEMGTLIDANPGHINNAGPTGIGDAVYQRTWP